MATNFIAELTGHMGSEARIIEEGGRAFAAFSLATTDSYKKDDEWHDKETQWHSILVFNPTVIENVKVLKKGSRIKMKATCYYRAFDVADGNGQVITKREISFVPTSIELAPLVKRTKPAE